MIGAEVLLVEEGDAVDVVTEGALRERNNVEEEDERSEEGQEETETGEHLQALPSLVPRVERDVRKERER